MILIETGQAVGQFLDDTIVFPIANAISQQDAFIRLYLIFFAQYPIGWFMHHCVKGTLLRHVFTITIGVAI